MNIIERITSIMSPKKFNSLVEEAVKREIDKVHNWMADTADGQRYDMPGIHIFASQADVYRISPLVGTALDILGDDMGLLDLNVKRRVGEEVRDVNNHEFEYRVYGSITYPNPLESKKEFLKATAIGYKLNGNHVWWLNRESWNDKPEEIWQWPFERVQPIPDGRQYISHYEYYPLGLKEPIKIPTWQIIHFKTYNPHNPFVGLSPMESLADTVLGEKGMRKVQQQMYTERGGSPPDILSFKEWIPDEIWREMQAEKERSAKSNKTMMLRGTKGDVSWQSRAVSNKESDFISLLSENMETIFNRLCPGLLAMVATDANRSTADAARATYEEKTRWPMLVEIGGKITSEIMPAYGRNLIAEFDDPRVVDRTLELNEQEAFERSHTLDEVRREYYGDDEIGDERGGLLIVQIRGASTGITDDNPDNPNNPRGNGQNNENLINPESETDTEQPQDDMMQGMSDDGTTVKAAIDALYKWRRQVADGRWEKAAKFSNADIPLEMERSIKSRLKGISNAKRGAAMMDEYIESLKPKPKVNPLDLLNGIEKGIRELEALR